MTAEIQGDVERADPGHLLVCEMRRIKDASGLSFGRLASRTHYSRSSWERFLNGKQLPTRIAVEELAGVVGEDPGALLRLWDLVTSEAQAGQPDAPVDAEPQRESHRRPGPGPEDAVAVGGPSGVAGPDAEADPEPEAGDEPKPDPGERGRRTWHRGLLAVSCVVAGAVAGSVGTALVNGSPSAPPPEEQLAVQTLTAPKGVHAGCKGDTCVGREPQAVDCQWDAMTVRKTVLRGLQIELRYSPECQAVWGRIENGAVGDQVVITDAWSRPMEATIRTGTDTYTRMLSTADSPAATVTICGRIPSQHDEECSPDKPSRP